jgi:hypothetical protein
MIKNIKQRELCRMFKFKKHIHKWEEVDRQLHFSYGGAKYQEVLYRCTCDDCNIMKAKKFWDNSYVGMLFK